MAYLILSDHQGEFDRRDLVKAMSIGRALDCDICVRDILLSRKHCKIERFDNRWIVADLGSKNGTRVANEVITRHVLNDGDVVQIGKIQVCFHAGAFVPLPSNGQQSRRAATRATDPTEALSGTVLGFQLFDMEEDSRVSGFPIPKPKPAEPESLRQETVHSMVTQIASTAWDVASTGKKPQAKPATKPPKEIIQRSQQIARAKVAAAVAAASNLQSAPAAEAASEPAEMVVHSEPVVERSKSPDEQNTISTWLACVYVLLSCAIGFGSIAVIVLRSHLFDKALGF